MGCLGYRANTYFITVPEINVEIENVVGMDWKNAVSSSKQELREIALTQAGQPIFTGSTLFEPHKDVKNIMITGGAGFMFVPPVCKK